MSMWHTILQDASFKGVHFDVLSLEESDGKAVAEHSHPFTNGVWLEDMGTQGRQIQVSAVFWGRQYHSRLNSLIETLMEQGAGVLVHPIWGRMPNMLPVSWQFRHDADNVDYATLDITLRQSGEPHKIFVFENQFLMQLEQLIAQIDAYRAALAGLTDNLTMFKHDAGRLSGSSMGFWAMARGVWATLRDMFDLPFPKWDAKRPSLRDWADDVDAMTQRALFAAAGIAKRTIRDDDPRHAKTRFDEALRQADAIATVPPHVSAQWGNRPRNHEQQQALLTQLLRQTALANGLQAACILIEGQGDKMNAPDLMHINRRLRLWVQDEIAALRFKLNQGQNPDTALSQYHQTEAVIECLRQASGSLNALVAAAINQKPPLVVRPAPFDGTIQQIAFAFYADISRSDELIRLNPHITHPCFIQQDTPINGYIR